MNPDIASHQKLQNTLKLLEEEMAGMLDQTENLSQMNRLMLECISRIAGGKSEDPRLDASHTLRGLAVFALNGLEMGKGLKF